ncbi:hypothetical protein MG293_005702 [Ovis ammon polii]|uniref:GAGE domain-containing protein n=1 Tax=Ovis ammon polii TaxID=230172 RepID=A0AAD4UG79_OVIAM|nr:hypothetical protein MG293_005702 [Ovis ammon polii]
MLLRDQHPNVEQPQQEEPPAEIQDITPRKEEVHGEDPVNRDEEEEKDASEDSGLEADFQELSVAKTGGEGGDGPDVREEFASNIEPVEMPEAGVFVLDWAVCVFYPHIVQKLIVREKHPPFPFRVHNHYSSRFSTELSLLLLHTFPVPSSVLRLLSVYMDTVPETTLSPDLTWCDCLFPF